MLPDEWFYTDHSGTVQGPFNQENMRLWHQNGYFNRDLPIKLRSWNMFYPFHTVFLDLTLAFTGTAFEPGLRGLMSVGLHPHQQQLQHQQQPPPPTHDHHLSVVDTHRQMQEQHEMMLQRQLHQQQQQQQVEQHHHLTKTHQWLNRFICYIQSGIFMDQ